MTINDTIQAERGGFVHSLHAEWNQFWKSPGWVSGMGMAVLIPVLLGVLYAFASRPLCHGPNGDVCPAILLGPDGEAVRDRFYYVYRPLSGDGSFTVRIISLTGLITYPPPNHDQIVPGVVPWAKAGIMIKQSTHQGSPYAAVMVTGSHGVRMQSNFTKDIAGLPGGVSATAPRWLRLTRSGDKLTGYESIDNNQWTQIGAAELVGLPATVEVGLFVTSPCDLTVEQMACRFTNATAVFDQVSQQGAFADAWSQADIGAESGFPAHLYGKGVQTGSAFTITGTGDIAPLGNEGGNTLSSMLIGTFAGVIAVILVAAAFATAEDRHGLNHALRIRRLAARAVVIGVLAFIAGLASAVLVVQIDQRIPGVHLLPLPPLTGVRIVAGTGALFALSAVFALALEAWFRRRLPAVLAAIALIILPLLLAILPFLPLRASQWLLRLTPAAAFAVQQSLPQYSQVINLYAPITGYYPLPPWAGLAVLVGYTALALGMAIFRLRRKIA